ncbi:hypothetical protein KUCAC02_029764 [Chaenocephalus aceratus]|nr:hypothetical protein KUCAC02_029764 [Chaenocephalus aceratus]
MWNKDALLEYAGLFTAVMAAVSRKRAPGTAAENDQLVGSGAFTAMTYREMYESVEKEPSTYRKWLRKQSVRRPGSQLAQLKEYIDRRDKEKQPVASSPAVSPSTTSPPNSGGRGSQRSSSSEDEDDHLMVEAALGQSVNYVLDETRPMEELIVKDCHTCLTRENLVTLGLRREMDSMVGTACLRLIHEAMQYQGKDVFVVDLHVPPTWLAPNHCDARLSLPVDSHKRDALISPCGSQGTLFCVHGRRCAHFTVEGQQTRTRIDSGSVAPLTRIPRKRRCDEVTMLPAETLLKIFVLVVLEDGDPGSYM